MKSSGIRPSDRYEAKSSLLSAGPDYQRAAAPLTDSALLPGSLDLVPADGLSSNLLLSFFATILSNLVLGHGLQLITV